MKKQIENKIQEIEEYNFLQELRNTTSTNAKQDILKKYKNNSLYTKILYYAYNPLFQFYVRKYNKQDADEIKFNIQDVFELLDNLRNREITGNAAIEAVENMYKFLNEFDKEIFSLILNKDIKCGINVRLINKVFDNLIPTIPYMGARAFNKKKVNKLFQDSDEVWSEVKYDGMFLNLIKENSKVKTLSRSGKDLSIEDIFQKTLKDTDNIVLTGELLVKGMNRYISNGLLNSYSSIKTKIKNNEGNENSKKIEKDILNFEKRYDIAFNEVQKRIYIVAWDMIPFKNWTEGSYDVQLKERRKVLENFAKDKDNIFVSEKKIVENFAQAMKDFKDKKENGEEGTILKDANAFYKDGKNESAYKCKLEMDIDLKITDLLYGNKDTKYQNFINRIVCESSDGLCKVQTGGLKESDMETITKIFENNKNSLINKIVSVECSGLSKDKNGNYSLLHPRFKEIREDKTSADDLNQIIAIEEMCYELS